MAGVHNLMFGRAGGPLKVSSAPGNEAVNIFGGVGGNAASTSQVVTATGGTPGYTYLWTYRSGSSYVINNGTTQAGAFFSTSLTPNQFKTGVYRITVTDAATTTAFADYTITFQDNP